MLKESDFPTVDEIAACLEHTPECIDVRLQVWDAEDGGGWTIHTGDASYDQDHRGFWGSGCVVQDDTPETLRVLAEELRNDALESAAVGDQLDESGDTIPRFYLCGICGHLHPEGFNGDCRDDANRWTYDRLESTYGVEGTDWTELATTDTEGER